MRANEGAAKRRKTRLVIAACRLALFLCGPLFAVNAPTAWETFSSYFPTECRSHLKNIQELHLPVADSAFMRFMKTGKWDLELDHKLQIASGDYLLHSVLTMEQRLQTHCKLPASVTTWISKLKEHYLRRMNWVTDFSDRSFRAFIVPKEEASALAERTKHLISQGRGLGEIFGGVQSVRGVLVVGADLDEANRLGTIVDEFCSKLSPCPFWDPAALYKVTLTPRPGVAAYLPELGVLVISKDLLKDSLLRRLVLLHELSHSADFRAEWSEGESWTAQFIGFSGWHRSPQGKWITDVKRVNGARKDALTLISPGSAYSLLPDPIYTAWVQQGHRYDGFVTGRSFEQSMARSDPSEDMADHVAMFEVLPARFCWQEVPVAPQKFSWISHHIFHENKTPQCGGK